MNQFSHHDQLPKFTKTGYMMSQIPQPYAGMAWDIYFNAIKLEAQKEKLKDAVKGVEPDYYPLLDYPHIINMIHNGLTPYLEKWCGAALEPSMGFGVRSYLRGSVLDMHVDRLPTHHISVIIMCEKDLGGAPDWSLDFVDHDGKTNKIYMDGGDMLYYESCKCSHGRPEPFQGNFYRNFYLHWKLKDWEYVGPHA